MAVARRSPSTKACCPQLPTSSGSGQTGTDMGTRTGVPDGGDPQTEAAYDVEAEPRRSSSATTARRAYGDTGTWADQEGRGHELHMRSRSEVQEGVALVRHRRGEIGLQVVFRVVHAHVVAEVADAGLAEEPAPSPRTAVEDAEAWRTTRWLVLCSIRMQAVR